MDKLQVTSLATSRWRNEHVYGWSYVCVLGGARVQPMKFGEDQRMYGEVIGDVLGHQYVAL